jgi:hypothetical protein
MHPLADDIRVALRTLQPLSRVHRDGDVAETAARLARAPVAPPGLWLEPPFAFRADATPAETGAAIAAAFDRFAASGMPSLPEIVVLACERAGMAPAAPLRRAAMAAAILASVPSGNAYHNETHTREVLANALWLAEANAHLAAGGVWGAITLSACDTGRLILYAVAHDIGHDGGSNGSGPARVPYRLEDRSVSLMRDPMARAGLDREEIVRFRAALRATDPAVRPAVRAATDRVLLGVDTSGAELPPELEILAETPESAMLAALLADADVLASAALSHDYHVAQNARLEQECRRPFQPAEVLAFFTAIVGGSMASAAGRLLDENLRAIWAAVAG